MIGLVVVAADLSRGDGGNRDEKWGEKREKGSGGIRSMTGGYDIKLWQS